MKFKTDENLPAEVADLLRDEGHDAETVLDEGLGGSPDPPILERVRREGRVLLTMDKGVADIRKYPPENYAGIILLRPRTSGRETVLGLLRRHLDDLVQADLTGRLLVMTDTDIRIR